MLCASLIVCFGLDLDPNTHRHDFDCGVGLLLIVCHGLDLDPNTHHHDLDCDLGCREEAEQTTTTDGDDSNCPSHQFLSCALLEIQIPKQHCFFQMIREMNEDQKSKVFD